MVCSCRKILQGGLTNTIVYRISDDRVKVYEEFLDFIDGNGFEITELDSLDGLKKFEIHAVGWK